MPFGRGTGTTGCEWRDWIDDERHQERHRNTGGAHETGAGSVDVGQAAALAPLMHLQLRVLEKTEVEKRLLKLERLLRESIGQH